MSVPIRLLTFTTLYPNASHPNHGVFVENRLRHLVGSGQASATVLAPVPWFPSAARAFGRWATFARVPRQETRHGIAVHHPRFLSLPGLNAALSPRLLAHAALPAARRLAAQTGGFDLIDAHYFYPDGVAAIALGRALDLPVVITGRGSDLTQFPAMAGPRRLILAAAGRAAGLVTVSAGLRDVLAGLGVPPARVTVLRNGVDTRLFAPVDRVAARDALGLPPDSQVLVSVGALIPRKRHHLTIAALTALPGWTLLVAGEGPERATLQALAVRLGVAGRVRLLGARPHAELPSLYSAADVSVLASSREGWANVLLESMACGTPVVASAIPGNDEVVRERAAGVIASEATANGLAAAVAALAADLPPRAATRAYAERFGWADTTQGQLDLFRRVLGRADARCGFVPAAA